MAGRAVAAAKEKTSFAVTCSLLSQYLKERKGGLEGCGLDMAPPAAMGGVAGVFRPPTTINLLSGLDAPAEEPNAAKTACEPRTSDPVELSLEKASTDPPLKAPTDKQNDENTREAAGEEAQQLTIFYGGKVVVFDNFPSTKVEDLLQILVNIGDGVDKASSSAAAQSLPRPAQNNLSVHPGSFGSDEHGQRRRTVPSGSRTPPRSHGRSRTRRGGRELLVQERVERESGGMVVYPTLTNTNYTEWVLVRPAETEEKLTP